MGIERRLAQLGLALPAATVLPPEVKIPFAWVRVRGSRVFVSGHGALEPDGSPAAPFGRVPSEVTLEAAQQSGRLAILAILSSLKTTLGNLDRISAWNVVNGHVNADAGYSHTTAVINPASELLLDLFGADVGAHARTAIGVSALPLNLPVVISAEVEISTR
jgi:enamine deaminase RidA (YjgF/YER057c/UK114 family)